MGDSPPRNIVLTILSEYRALLLEFVAVAAALGTFVHLRPKINETLTTGIEDWHLIVAAGTILLVLGVLHWIRRLASLLKEIRELDPGRLYGREAEVEGWLQHLSNHRLVWLHPGLESLPETSLRENQIDQWCFCRRVRREGEELR
jgi:hypothetical protein